MRFVRKALIPAAGLGTRFLPVTKAVAKELLPVLNKPLVQYALEEALASGIEEMLFISSRGKENLQDFFDQAPEVEARLEETGKDAQLASLRALVDPLVGRLAFVRQPRPLGLGHAILCGKSWIGDEPFAVLLPDDFMVGEKPCIGQLMEDYQLSQGNVVGALDVALEDVSSYGILDIDASQMKEKSFFAKGVIEKPKPQEAPSCRAVIGRYVLHPDIFSVLETQERGAGGEIQLTDALSKMIPTHGLQGRIVDSMRFDCGRVEGMLEANIAMAAADEKLAPRLKEMMKKWCEI